MSKKIWLYLCTFWYNGNVPTIMWCTWVPYVLLIKGGGRKKGGKSKFQKSLHNCASCNTQFKIVLETLELQDSNSINGIGSESPHTTLFNIVL